MVMMVPSKARFVYAFGENGDRSPLSASEPRIVSHDMANAQDPDGRTGTPSPRPLDATDRLLIEALQQDGRLSVNELAARISVSRANAYQRLDRLRATGVIKGFTAVVDPAAIGLTISALILANVEQHAWRAARDTLRHLPGLQYLAMTTGGFDFALLVRVADVETLRDVVLDRLQGMPEVRSTQTVFVLDEDDLLAFGARAST
jgi:DNA-binding Lrp family transcriptional regulator